jgi:tRNA threonylcarbamoyl adenosine modification protein (Sua5/YciO/YrdC/YwlC family)
MAQSFSIHPTHPEPRLVRQAAALLQQGGVIAYPTDSSYALGCALDEANAIKRIRTLRALDDRHHLTLMCRDMADIGRFARLDNWQFTIVRQGVPGSFTFLLPASRDVPRRAQHARRNTIGVRVSDHPVVKALLGELGGPILTSTLTLPGESEPENDAATIRVRIGKQIDAIIDAGPCPNQPTSVVDLAVDPPAIVRLGRGEPERLGLRASVDAPALAANSARATRVK